MAGDSSGALPDGLPTTLTVLDSTATTEQLKEALKKLPPNCAGIAASYQCGNHDNTPQYSGEIISVSAGDELAMNSMVLTVINIDGEGNGSGLIKIPMMNNLKFGLKLEGIKVAKGGCIVAGKAALSGVSVQLLNDELRGKLQVAYAAYNKLIDGAIADAGAIAQTYNGIADLLKDVRAKAKAVVEKLQRGEKPSAKELKTLQDLAKTATNAKQKELEIYKKQAGADTSRYVAALSSWLTQQQKGIGCVGDLVAQAPAAKKGGPNQEWLFFVADCLPTELLEPEPEQPKNDKPDLDPHYVENINKEEQAYSCNCGWIDLNHAFTITTRSDAEALGLGANNLWKQLLEEKGKSSDYAKGFKVKYSQDVKYGVSIGIHRDYFVKYGLSKAVKKQIALAIFQEVSMAYESMQKINIFSSSSFEPSDLVSNILSFYFFVENYTKESIFALCNKRSREESLAIYKLYPETFTDEKYKNRKFTPRFFPNKYCTEMTFPKEFQRIKLVTKDGKLFRDWNNYDDKPPK